MKPKKGKKKNKRPQAPRESTRKSERITDFIHTIETGSDSEDYAERLRGIMATWRGLVSEERKKGQMSLFDLSSTDEARIALEALKSTAIGFGIRLSRIIVEYFAVIWRCNAKDVWAKTRNTVNTIRITSLGVDDELSAITSAFIASIESIDFDEEEKNHLCHDKDCYCNGREDEVGVSETENKILGMIFYRVLFLEILFGLPFFSGEVAEEDSVMRISEFVATESSFEERLLSLESEIDRWKEAEMEYTGEDLGPTEKKATIGVRIEEIWKSLY